MNESVELIIENIRESKIEEAEFRYDFCIKKYEKNLVDQLIRKKITMLLDTDEAIAIELNRLLVKKVATSQSKTLVGVMAILFGSLGVHWFIVGETNKGITYLLITIIVGPITCFIASAVMSIIGIVDGIRILSQPGENYQKFD